MGRTFFYTQGVHMTLSELQTIIMNAGGGEYALVYAEELLAKINNVASHQVPGNYWLQFTKAREAGDFRGRVLEINLVNYFALQNVPLEYEVKQQGASGDVDLKWRTNDVDVYIEVKLLRQDKKTKKRVDDQLECCGVFAENLEDDTSDVLRLQYDIIDKATLKKFVCPPLGDSINLIAIDVSELQLGTVDAPDCVLATLGPEEVGRYFGPACIRKKVLGLFECCPRPSQADWTLLIDQKLAGKPHPKQYIHGVIFLFREPKDLGALSYNLAACIAWNASQIDDELRECINSEFHRIIPQKGF